MGQLSLFGFKIAIDISSETVSSIGQGFYFFTAYCLISLLGTHLAFSNIKARYTRVSQVAIFMLD